VNEPAEYRSRHRLERGASLLVVVVVSLVLWVAVATLAWALLT
jgi:hypothetical protein